MSFLKQTQDKYKTVENTPDRKALGKLKKHLKLHAQKHKECPHCNAVNWGEDVTQCGNCKTRL
jgi:hypothetical protein